MKVALTNMMGVREGTIDLVPGCLTAVIGRNMSGKTSLAVGVGAVLAHQHNPLGRPATKKEGYLSDGANSGAVSVIEDDGAERVRWDLKDGELTISTQSASAISAPAAGLIDFANLGAGKERIAMWEKLFLPPSKLLLDKVKAELEPRLSEQEIAGVLDTIEKQGWENLDKVYGDRARREKASWRQVTGENYTVKRAADWHPQGWLASYDGLALEDCEREVRERQDALSGLHVAQAITAADIERGKAALRKTTELRELTPELLATQKEAEKKLEEARDKAEKIKEKGREAKAALNAHLDKKPTQHGGGLLCPHCEGPLLAIPSTAGDIALMKHDPEAEEEAMRLWEEERERLHKATADQSALYKVAMQPVNGFEEARRLANEAYLENQHKIAAAAEQAQLADATATKDNSKAITKAERELEQLRKRNALVSQYDRAKDHHESCAAYTLIASILGPKGVRATAMEGAMDNLNNFLGIVSEATGWPRVEVDRSYNISIGRRANLKMCSESERWRGQVSLQIAIARLLRDRVVVIDRADILDEVARVELVKLLDMLGTRDDPPAMLVCATGTADSDYWTKVAEVPIAVYDMMPKGRLEPLIAADE